MKVTNNTPLIVKQNAKSKGIKKETQNVSFNGGNPLLPSGAKKGLIEGLGNFMKNSKKHLEKILDFDGMSMTHQMLMLTTFGFVNIPRVIHARTKDERREILWRDYITVATICFAFPTLNKLAATGFRKTTGIVCSFNDDRKNQNRWTRFKEHFRLLDVDKGDNVLPNEGIKNAYTDIHKHKGGISGLFKYLDKQKGNIEKMLKIDSNLDKPIKDMIETYKKSTGKSFDNSNSAFVEMFEHAFGKTKDSLKTEEKDIYKKAETALKKAFQESKFTTKKNIFGKIKKVPVHNKFVQKALLGTKTMGAINIFLVIPGFLGLFLPWLNEQVTKNKYAHTKHPKVAKSPISKNTMENLKLSANIHFMNSNNRLNAKQKQVFQDFIKTDKKSKKDTVKTQK